MNLLLNNQKTKENYAKKEVEKMKRIGILILGIFFLAGGLNVFAVETGTILSTTQDSTIHIEYVYNAYGVGISSVQTTTTITTTKKKEEDGTETNSTTTTVSTSESEWMGGSLKIKSTTGTSTTEGDDDLSSTTTFETTYTYDENGRLIGASGTSDTESDDGNGKTSRSHSVDTYIIQDGEALRSKSETTGTNYGTDDTKTADFTETTTYEYQLIGGSWELVREVSASTSAETNGNEQVVTKTRTYSRDANGVCTGISQSAEGTYTAVNSNGGKQTYTMENYKAEFKFDAEQGWYLTQESWDWKHATGSNGGSGGGSGVYEGAPISIGDITGSMSL